MLQYQPGIDSETLHVAEDVVGECRTATILALSRWGGGGSAHLHSRPSFASAPFTIILPTTYHNTPNVNVQAVASGAAIVGGSVVIARS